LSRPCAMTRANVFIPVTCQSVILSDRRPVLSKVEGERRISILSTSNEILPFGFAPGLLDPGSQGPRALALVLDDKYRAQGPLVLRPKDEGQRAQDRRRSAPQTCPELAEGMTVWSESEYKCVCSAQ